jgi:two-component system NtrC family sensor kinase
MNAPADPPSPDPQLLAALLQCLPMRVVLVDRQHRYTYANPAALDYLGLQRAQLIGRTIEEVRGPKVFQSYLQVAERLFAGEAQHWEGWADYPNLGRRYMEEWLTPYPATLAPGEVAQVVMGCGRDLTELKTQAQQLGEQVQALQRAEQLKAVIVDHALAAIVTSDAAGRIVEFNPAAVAMFGLARDEALGRTVAEVMIPQRHRSAHNRGMDHMARGGKPRLMGQRLQMHATRADGSEFPIEMVLWQTSVGDSSYYTASINDMSERERSAALIERQREALRQSEKLTAMGSLLAGVAHELNNPLSIVMGRASLLEDKAAGTPLASDAHSIREAAERCGRIVRTFLNMARSRPAQRSAVSLNDLALAAADMLQYSLRSHGVALALQLDPALPMVNIDGDQIGQVVLNLIVNAQQALAAAPAPHKVDLATGTEAAAPGQEARVWLQVSDTGPGVPAEHRENIFEPFFTTKPEGLGTGLGLAVSRSLAREHGGDLTLVPAASGACFRLTLPLSGAPAVAPKVATPPPLPEADSSARLLVVDDEPEIAELARDFLESAGYDVAVAESGAVALEILAEARFDAVISDLRMPGMDGAALWRELQARAPALAARMLFVTGDTLSPGADSFLAQTGCPTLDKPFSKADLLAKVRALLAP